MKSISSVSFRFVPALVCFFLTAQLETNAGTIYTVTNLGTLGGSDTFVYRINDFGHAVGSSRIASGDYNAYLYDGTGMQNLGVPAGGTESKAYGVNNSGQVVGTSYVDGKAQATLWNSGVTTSLGTLGGADSYALAINGSGQIAGGSTNSSGQGHAFVYGGGSMEDVGAQWAGDWSSAYDINQAGQVTGYGKLSQGGFRGFVWSADNGMTVLSTLGGANSYGLGINDAGQVVGQSSVASGYGHAFLYSDGVMSDLGTLGGASSFAYGINNFGDVVGFSWWNGGSSSHAFLYRGGVMVDLNDFIAPLSGWELLEAYDINDAGQIVGVGAFQGERLAFRLDPVFAGAEAIHNPEPGTLSMLVTGVLVFGMLYRLRRRRNSSRDEVAGPAAS
jgi:probable HAF family extracellular repeat protein